ncbi:MAG: acylneuraminate cytidylyltransferase [Anaerolineaceae bacterium]|jgi:N-acylneuraminate cytidylyltransferase|nr:acylneuraminate cytidylyltransferase [Anaerolineaceae bacterium]
MVKQTEVLALIPARGGSKGIPRKNLRDFAGAPLIAYSIAAAKQAERVTRVIVSTDDPEIADVARAWGAEVPFMRPAQFAQDDSTDLPVFEHALEWLEQNENYMPDIVIQLRPTSPVRPIGLLDQAVELLLEHPEVDCVRGVVPSVQNPFKMWQIDSEGRLTQLLEVAGLREPYNAPRQALPQTYWQTGHIDAIRSNTILAKHSLTGDIILPLLIDPLYTVDIDTPDDFLISAKLISDPRIKAVDPLKNRRPFPERISYLVMDFDGVLTDDKVYVDQDGRETVRCSRSDGFGIALLKEKSSIQAMILSRETNPVVTARAKKLDIEVFQSVLNKDLALKSLIEERNLKPEEIIYIGNDLNDLVVLPLVGYFVCPADAHPQVLRQADLVLNHLGGKGAVRELVEKILEKQSNQENL